MNRPLKSRKGISGIAMVMSLVLVATALVIGVWISSSMQRSFDVPTSTVAENIALTNDTASTLSYPYLSSLISVANSSDTHPHTETATACSTTSTTVTCLFNGTYTAGTYTVTYTYNEQSANDTTGDIFSTTWDSYSMGAVSLIVIAAVAIIGLLVTGMGTKTGAA